jgi:stage II sporulation protein M
MFLAPDAESPSGIGALWAIIAGMVVVVILLLRVGNAIFNREELLGRTIDQLNLKGILSRVGRFTRAVDLKGTPAVGLLDWYRRGVFGAVRRMKLSIWATIGVFLFALVAGYVVGQLPEWRLALPPNTAMTDTADVLSRYTNVPLQTGAFMLIVWQNGRILLAALMLSIFTFGAAALVLTPAVYFVLGYIFSQIILAGYSPAFMFAGVLTHGIVEIPVIVLATAAALRMGAVITRLPRGMTVGQAWTLALSDTLKIALGLIIPGLILAALIEAFITPHVVVAILGGG